MCGNMITSFRFEADRITQLGWIGIWTMALFGNLLTYLPLGHTVPRSFMIHRLC